MAEEHDVQAIMNVLRSKEEAQAWLISWNKDKWNWINYNEKSDAYAI